MSVSMKAILNAAFGLLPPSLFSPSSSTGQRAGVRNRNISSSVLILLFSAPLLISFVPQDALAWSVRGHMTVAEVGFSLLSNNFRSKVIATIGLNDIRHAFLWPDLLSDSAPGGFKRLPTNWIADVGRPFYFPDANRADSVPQAAQTSVAKLVETLPVGPLIHLPLGSFGGRGTTPPPVAPDLAFRNFTRATRAKMGELARRQHMAGLFGLAPRTSQLILRSNGGAFLDNLPHAQQDSINRTLRCGSTYSVRQN